MDKRYIWIPVVLWLVTLAAFVGVAVLFILQMDTVQATVTEGAETVRYFGPHMHNPLGGIVMVILGFLFVGFIMRMLFKPFMYYGPWGHHRHKHFGHRGRPPWWGEPEGESSGEAKEEPAE
jgi:hypothetical protein